MLGKGIATGKNKKLYNIIGKKYLNKKSFPYGNKINFNSIRTGEIIGEHEVSFSSGKEISYLITSHLIEHYIRKVHLQQLNGCLIKNQVYIL